MMRLNDSEPLTNTEPMRQISMSEDLIAVLRQRVAQQYYDQPQVIELIARAILHSRGLYP
jgi:hypothetical protein